MTSVCAREVARRPNRRRGGDRALSLAERVRASRACGAPRAGPTVHGCAAEPTRHVGARTSDGPVAASALRAVVRRPRHGLEHCELRSARETWEQPSSSSRCGTAHVASAAPLGLLAISARPNWAPGLWRGRALVIRSMRGPLRRPRCWLSRLADQPGDRGRGRWPASAASAMPARARWAQRSRPAVVYARRAAIRESCSGNAATALLVLDAPAARRPPRPAIGRHRDVAERAGSLLATSSWSQAESVAPPPRLALTDSGLWPASGSGRRGASST